MRRIAILTVAMIAWSPAANANLTGNKLKDYCSFFPGQIHTEASNVCVGYVGGTLDTLRLYNAFQKPKQFCEVDGVEFEQLMAIIKKHFEDYPERLHFTASTLILEAMKKAFPCK